MTRHRLLVLTIVVVGVCAGCAVWNAATGGNLTSPGVLSVPVGVLTVAGLLVWLIITLVDSNPYIRILVGLIVGVAVSEAAAFALIRPLPGSTAIVVYGMIGLIVGTTIGLASLLRSGANVENGS